MQMNYHYLKWGLPYVEYIEHKNCVLGSFTNHEKFYWN